MIPLVPATVRPRRSSLLLYAGACISVLNDCSVSSFVLHPHHVFGVVPNSKNQPIVAWAVSSSSVTSSYYPDGLLDQDSFQENCRLDETLTNLRKQLPTVLTKPLTIKDAELVYDENIVLLGPKGEVLSNGIDELVSLSSTLVATTWSAKTAQKAIMSTFSSSGNKNDGNKKEESPIVNFTLVWDKNKRIVAKWSTTAVVGGQQVEGTSELVLKDERIVTHKLLDVYLDGRTIVAIGETIANLRRAVRSVQFPQSSPLMDAIFEVRDGFLAAAAAQSQQPLLGETSATESFVSPLYFVNKDHNATNASSSTFFDDMSVLMDSSNSTAVSAEADFPIPGSDLWKEYMDSHIIMMNFWRNDLPLLAGEKIVDNYNDLETCNFVSDATLVGPNKKKPALLMEGGTKIARAYQTLAALRRASNGVWNIQSARMDWRNRTCDIEWNATIPTTGISAIEGSDRFNLNEKGVIESIQQLKLRVAGNLIVDPEPVRAFLTTLGAYDGVRLASAGGDITSDLLKRLKSIMTAGPMTPTSRSSSAKAEVLDLPPQLDIGEAASVYNLMRTLHEDFAHVQDLAVAPASSFLQEDVTLQGYMGETLAKGTSAYRQSIGLALASLRGAIRAKSASLDRVPRVTIEFTRRGDLQVSLELRLAVNPLLGSAPILVAGSRSPSLPLKIEVLSEYRLKNGRIRKHVLLESRINGQLTPGDVVSRWIKGSNNNMNEGVSALWDLLSWASRSVGGGGGTPR